MWKINQAARTAKRLEDVGLEIVMMPMVGAIFFVKKKIT